MTVLGVFRKKSESAMTQKDAILEQSLAAQD